MKPETTALVVSAHGTPESLDDLPAFLANIRRGRPAPDEMVREIRRRYEAIGGRSPLLDITNAQARAIGTRVGLPARTAMRLWSPYPREVLRELYATGIRRIISLPMAPYSVHVYHAAIEAALAELPGPTELLCVPAWNLEPGFIAALAAEIHTSIAAIPQGRKPVLILSAHSLPEKVIQSGDPYKTLFEQTTLALSALLPRDLPVRVSYQSQGMTADPWLGPDLPTTFREVRNAGHDHVLIAPVGFMSDHVEVLYDIDIEAREIARTLGLELSRTRTLNDSPAFMDALAHTVRTLLESSSTTR